MKPLNILITWLLITLTAVCAHAATDLEVTVKKAIAMAEKQMDLSGAACLTNAGYARVNNKDTRLAVDLLYTQTGISFGKGSLLPVHDRADDPLYFAFVTRPAPDKLMMMRICLEGDTLAESGPINIQVKTKTDFTPFTRAFGKQAFSLVTLANGWADGVPWEILQGALYHDHLCCGVFTGYFITRYILDEIPLAPKENYTYIGAPAWCQDDLIMTFLNLTPGKHGYCTMSYPWDRPWKTSARTYDQLGGVIVRFNREKHTGTAHVLKFDWHFKTFKEELGQPDMELNWKQNPWLHVAYNRFLMKHLEQPETFVSIIKEVPLKEKADLNRLVQMGANPLKILLGTDEAWEQSLKGDTI